MADKLSIRIRDPSGIRIKAGKPPAVAVGFGPVTAGGGTTDYEKLKNLPTLNGVEIRGDKTADDFGIAPVTDYSMLQNPPAINGAPLSGGENSLASLGIARASSADINKLF